MIPERLKIKHLEKVDPRMMTEERMAKLKEKADKRQKDKDNKRGGAQP